MNKPVMLPAWIAACVALASAIVIAAGSVVAIALWQVGVVQQVPLTPRERDELEDNFHGGSFVNAGTYRVCLNGQFYFFYSDGKQSTFNEACWK